MKGFPTTRSQAADGEEMRTRSPLIVSGLLMGAM
jgi:hypothetical protein